VIIERKKDTDLASSISGKKNDPDFYRWRDQKMRMHGFDRETGARCGVIVEEYMKNFQKKYIGRLPEDSFKSAVVHVAWRDGFIVDHTVDIHDTERSLNKLCRDLVEHQFTNVVFPHLFCRAAAGLAAGTISRYETDRDGYRRDIQAQVVERVSWTRQLMNGVVPVEKLGQDHSSAISIKKSENKDPKMCWAMQLRSFPGVKEKAKFIAARYPTMHDLVHAYDGVKTEKGREQLLAVIETDTVTPKGNKRKIGPSISANVYHASMGKRVRVLPGGKVQAMEPEKDPEAGTSSAVSK
jgi:hypothetical protein